MEEAVGGQKTRSKLDVFQTRPGTRRSWLPAFLAELAALQELLDVAAIDAVATRFAN